MTQSPDILLLVLDTQRADRLSCYGYEQPTSPNLDAFAQDALRFRQACSAAQWTVPSHSSMFTGLYPGEHRTQQSSSILPDSIPTIAEQLSESGYYTAAFCNNPLVGVVNNGLRRGFQSWMNYSGLLTSRPNQAGAKRTPVGSYRQGFKRVLAKWLHKVQDSFARSDALLAFAFTPFMVPIWQTALSFKGNTSKSLRDAANLLIERKGVPGDKPVFAFVNLMGTHMPFHPDREFMEEFAPEISRDKAAQRYLRRFNSDVLGWLTPTSDKMPAKERALLNGMYNAEIATQDRHLGAFFARLRATGALDNTLIIVCADHGEHLGEKHFIGHTVSLYHELTHVPLLVRDGRNPAGRGETAAQPVSLRRVYHTILDAAGLADKRAARYSLLAETIDDPEADPDRGTVFAEAVTPENVLHLLQRSDPELAVTHYCDQRRIAVWQKPYKLILTGAVLTELYHYEDDPDELHNLVDEKPEVVDYLRREIEGYITRTAAVAVTPGAQQEAVSAQVAERLRALGYIE
ncbi:MAG: sulfatase-like hydrolase/transferase [Caldilineaceae bacterium]|nr:sulfatase-like hydrolase/transferase [Caldilineaceae bacterium]MCB9138729.1 sulfatase-like hydrolase/transferase [Caldilineaceae bacterium]